MTNSKKIKVHPTVLFTVSYFLMIGEIKKFLLLILFVTIHELSHVIVAIIYGARLEEILITPIGERAIIRNFETLQMYKRIIILLAGPFISMVIGIFFKAFFYTGEILMFCADINLAIGIFNLLPVMPLDGGSILLQILNYKKGVLKAGSMFIKYSKCISMLFIIIGIIQVALFPFNLSLLIIGLYLFTTNKFEYTKITADFYKYLFSNKYDTGRALKVRHIYVDAKVSIKSVIKMFNTDTFYIVYFIGENGLEIKSQKQIADSILAKGLTFDIKDCA